MVASGATTLEARSGPKARKKQLAQVDYSARVLSRLARPVSGKIGRSPGAQKLLSCHKTSS